MNIVIYESHAERFFPLINMYPQYQLRVGLCTIAEYVKRLFPRATIHLIARNWFGLKRPAISSPAVYLSAQSFLFRPCGIPRQDSRLMIDSCVAGFVKHKAPFPTTLSEVESVIRKIKRSEPVEGLFFNAMWDLVRHNSAVMSHQFGLKRSKGTELKRITLIGDKRDVFLARGAQLLRHVVIDVTDGPVYIEKDAMIKSFSVIYGPAFIGAHTVIDRAKITKSSIGPESRIGGEVEGSIFQGYVNKHHEGFIGHSFVGEWVNLGALTTNSDLKNNYSEIRVTIKRRRSSTNMIKCGCFIGDHTKTGIGTLIPTGAVVGSFVNFFGGGMMPSFVPSFRWLSPGGSVVYQVKKAIETARVVMKRRGVLLSKDYERLIARCFRCRDSL